MSALVLIPEMAPERTTPGDAEDDLDHFYCCDPDVAYCGADISGAYVVMSAEMTNLCPMCEVLDDTLCPRCKEVR